MSFVLNTKISLLTSYIDAYGKVISYLLNDKKPTYITVNNVHTVTEAAGNGKYNEVLNNSFLSLPDGKPLVIYLKLKGYKNINRIFGPTFFEKTLELGQKDGLKHYFFGASQNTLDKMINVIKGKYPKAIIAGSFSPPFKPFTEEENTKFIEEINKSGADIIWVGLGAPKQELWMYDNYKRLNKGIMIGIGAGFSYLAGDTKHAPKWMKDLALEWLYRLIQEPRRLWKRYLVTNTLFLWYCFLELLHLKNFYK